ncbi:MFS transporter [Lichenicoccus sp.]|uniref:MFS transporter n=1 Tax=Lichenicoccus sp. TaxID=2781899 RepID=UPI003D09F21A
MSGNAARGGLRPVAALLLAVLFLVFGTNLQGILLPMLGHARGSSMIAIGLFSAGWSAGFVLACLCIGQVLARLGYAGAFIALALLSAAAAALLFALPTDRAWIALRVVTGFCYGGLSAIVEGWLVERAGAGIAFAGYMIVNLLASLGGTLSLNFIRATGPAPFAVAVAATALAIVPIALGGIPSPPAPPPFRPRLGSLIRGSPVGALGCVGVGIITGAIGGLGPVFGMMSGLTMHDTTLMLAANSVGGALAYLPLAALAERLDRRVLLSGVILLGLLLCAPIVLLTPSPPLLILLLGAFGFVQYPLYGLCVGIVNRACPERPSSHVAGELVLLFGLGTIAGPLAGSQFLQLGTKLLFTFIAMVLASMLALNSMGSQRSPAPTLAI